jgi:DnaJ domain
MEIVGLAVLLAGLLVVGVFFGLAILIAHSERSPTVPAGPGRDLINASIIHHLLMLGGDSPDAAKRRLRAIGRMAPVIAGIDITSWGERYRQLASREACALLLEQAVATIIDQHRTIPLAQYSAILELNFALGFQTDSLFRLRHRFAFDYVDHARHGRPPEADRGGSGASPFDNNARSNAADATRLLEILGLAEPVDRQRIIAAYRRLASEFHPDHHLHEPAEVQAAAAARFIVVTDAYSRLLTIHHAD